MLSEISQTKTNYCMVSLICAVFKGDGWGQVNIQRAEK